MTQIMDKLVNQEIINKNLILLAGSTIMAAGALILRPTLFIIAVKTLGFTAGGVLKGKLLTDIYKLA